MPHVNPEVRRKYMRRYKERHPEYVEKQKAYRREYYRNKKEEKKHLWNQKNLEARKRTRLAVLVLLGGKCANPNCRHLNTDGSLGCTDERLLQVDHPLGGGNEERRNLGGGLRGGSNAVYRKVLECDGEGYRLLCAQCNWLHRYEDF